MLTNSDAVRLNELLKKCTPGNLPPDVFEAIGRVSVYPAVEIIPIRIIDGNVEVLLMERSADDITWPSMLHTPGTILRPTDSDIQNGIDRVVNDELSNTEIINGPKFMRNRMYNHLRGRGLGLEYVAMVGDSADGKFYRVDSLPANVIEEQIPTIKYVAEVCQDTLTSEGEIL